MEEKNRFKNYSPKQLLKIHNKDLDLKNNFCFCCKEFKRINEERSLYKSYCTGIHYNTAEFPKDYPAFCWNPRDGYDQLTDKGFKRAEDIRKGEVDV